MARCHPPPAFLKRFNVQLVGKGVVKRLDLDARMGVEERMEQHPFLHW
jgi:hypothetical protein